MPGQHDSNKAGNAFLAKHLRKLGWAQPFDECWPLDLVCSIQMGLSWYGKLITFYNILQPPLAVFSLSSSKSVQNTSQLNSILRPKRWASSPKRREGCKHWRQMRSVLLHKGTRLSRGSVRDCCQWAGPAFIPTNTVMFVQMACQVRESVEICWWNDSTSAPASYCFQELSWKGVM